MRIIEEPRKNEDRTNYREELMQFVNSNAKKCELEYYDDNISYSSNMKNYSLESRLLEKQNAYSGFTINIKQKVDGRMLKIIGEKRCR